MKAGMRSLRPKAYSPFERPAVERQQRMGLLREDGTPNQEAIQVISRVFAGQYFDDLCDSCRDMSTLREQLQQYIKKSGEVEPKQRFLLLCLQYDAFYRPLPDPIWWMSGNIELTDLFSQGFVTYLRQMLEGM